MKKSLIIGLIALFVCITFVTCIEAIVITYKDITNNENILTNDNENFDCLIIGRASHTGFIEPGLGGDVILRSIIPILKFDNISIGFGYKKAYVGDPWEYYPAKGWIWTKGSNGEVTWSGDILWGNLGKKSWSVQDPFISDKWGRIDYEIKKGVIGFTGLRIGFSKCLFIGIASHVNIFTEFPG